MILTVTASRWGFSDIYPDRKRIQFYNDHCLQFVCHTVIAVQRIRRSRKIRSSRWIRPNLRKLTTWLIWRTWTRRLCCTTCAHDTTPDLSTWADLKLFVDIPYM